MSIQEYVFIVLGVTAGAVLIAPGRRSRIAFLFIVPALGLAFFLTMLLLFALNPDH